MSTYRVTHAFADKQPGDLILAADIGIKDFYYLLEIGAIVPNGDVQPAPKRAKKVTTKSED
jgi:hypothetical protein